MKKCIFYIWVIFCILFISSNVVAQTETEIEDTSNNNEVKEIKNVSWDDKDNLDSYYEEIKGYTVDLPVVRQQTGYSNETVLHDILSHYYQAGYGACIQYTSDFDNALSTYAHEATHGLCLY